jgi:hypothetical protein
MLTTPKSLNGRLLDFDKVLVFFLIFSILISCNQRNNKNNEDLIYLESINVVLEYDNFYDSGLDIDDTMAICNEFIFAINYLGGISDIRIECDYSGIIPKVQNRQVLKNALYNWELWWNKNRNTLTLKKCESTIMKIKKSGVLIKNEIPLRFRKIMR